MDQGLPPYVTDLVATLQALPPALTVAIIAALPVLELRAGIIAGLLLMRLPWELVLPAALVGNLVFVLPVVLIGTRHSAWLRRHRLTGWLFEWTLSRGQRHRRWIDCWGTVGLLVFCALPFPPAGTWSGVALAIVGGMRPGRALLAIGGGTVIQGVILTAGILGTVAGIKAFVP